MYNLRLKDKMCLEGENSDWSLHEPRI